MTELVKILNNPEDYYPGNFDTPQRANALLTGLCQDAATEIAKLQAEVERLKANIALDKKAENARELGLSYDDEPKIGCVNHDCDQCKAVQEPLGYLEIDDIESQREYPHNCRNVNLWHEGGEGMAAIYTTPPAPQPVPVKTYQDGKPWPVAPKPWVGLTDEDIEQGHKESWVDKQAFESAVWWAEKKLKEKNT